MKTYAHLETVQIAQGKVKDCYLLALIDCLLHLKNGSQSGQEKIDSLFKVLPDNSIELRIPAEEPVAQSDAAQKYQYRRDEAEDLDVFIITEEQVNAIKEHESGSYSSSVHVQILEHILPYYMKNWEPDLYNSIDAHGLKIRDFGGEDKRKSISELLGFVSTKLTLEQAIKLQKLLPNQPIQVSIHWKSLDDEGINHYRHSLRLEQLVYKEDTDEFEIVLINPHNNKSQIHMSLDEFRKRNPKLSTFAHDKTTLKQLKKILKSNENDINTLRMILAYEYPETEYSEFYDSVQKIKKFALLEHLIDTHNFVMKEIKELHACQKYFQFPVDNDKAVQIKNNFLKAIPYSYDKMETDRKLINKYKSTLIETYEKQQAINNELKKSLAQDEITPLFPFQAHKAKASALIFHIHLEQAKQPVYEALVKILRDIIDTDKDEDIAAFFHLAQKLMKAKTIGKVQTCQRMIMERRASIIDREKLIDECTDCIDSIKMNTKAYDVPDGKDVKMLAFKALYYPENKSMDELKADLKALKNIAESAKKAKIITQFISDYMKNQKSDTLFSTSKYKKAMKIQTAFLNVPIPLRGHIFDDLSKIPDLAPQDRTSILQVRKEILTHRNFIKKLMFNNENLEHYADLLKFDKAGATRGYKGIVNGPR